MILQTNEFKMSEEDLDKNVEDRLLFHSMVCVFLGIICTVNTEKSENTK